MSVLTIVTKGTPVLHQRAAEVDPKEIATPVFQKLIADMVETMYAAKGVGIAATQIGKGLRIFIAESPEGPIAMVNPVFVKKSAAMANDQEGCLSIPKKYDDVMRHKSVTIKALSADGKPVQFTAHGMFARILQHELDHLDGKLYVDRIAEQRELKP